MYEIRLKKEFTLNRMLQTSEVKDYIKIYYKERNGRDAHWKSIMTDPTSELYPNSYKITYRFPKMYVGPDQYVRNWEKSFYCTIDEQTHCLCTLYWGIFAVKTCDVACYKIITKCHNLFGF